MAENFIDIDLIFNRIMVGDSSILVTENINLLNSEALRLYNIPVLNECDIHELKNIIMICNVLYNRTDMTVLPIEDGFYDLLLEKYKTYDANFQVGSAVVEFKNFIENDLDKPIAKQAIRFSNPEHKDSLHQDVYDNIMRKGQQNLNIQDFYKSPIKFTDKYIPKRSHNTEHNHPMLVGTLDKCKFVMNADAIAAGVFNDPNVKVLERDFFQDHINKGIYRKDRIINVVCELKYDGVSVEGDCGFTLQSARSRGDTGIGAASDMTPILKDYLFKHASCMIGEEPLGVKFEAIMTKSNLYQFNIARGRSYANCRSAIVGLFGASDAYMFRDLITLVPLALDVEQFNSIHPDTPITNRLQEIEFLNKVFVSHGEPLRYCYFSGTVDEILYLIKVFWDEAKIARDYLNFIYDGIVVSYTDNDIKEALGRKNFINKYSMAVKFDPLEKQTTFRGYTYEVGQHGDITPMIHYDPVEFNGTIHTKSTGSSLKRFNDLALKYGDHINVTYVHDVMPYVSRLDCDYNRNNPNPVEEIIKVCPVCGTELVVSESGKSLLCPNMNCAGRSNQRMVNMFSKMNIKGFADASFKTLKCTHLYELSKFSEQELIDILGDADGKGFYNIMRTLMTEPQKDYIIMGSLGFSSIAHKKWQQILQSITIKDLYSLFVTHHNDLLLFENKLRCIIPNIGDVTARTIANEFGFFADDILFIINSIKIVDSFGSSSEGKLQIRFTGFRNQQLSQQLITAGYDADDSSSVTKKTDILLIPYEGFNSSKVDKASKNPQTKIVPVQDFIDNMAAYGVTLQ